MVDVVECLRPHERRKVHDLAARWGESAEVVTAKIVSAWLALAADAPGALPSDPMQGLSLKGVRK